MKKIIVAPDSFKGTLTQSQFCRIAERVICRVFPGCDADLIPVADGGEGSVDCFLSALGGERVTSRVTGAFPGEHVNADYAVLPSGEAVIELAACAGLPLAGEKRDPAKTTTYGVGQLIADAAHRGCRNIILCLGGSATNDAGCGMAAALGYIFSDADGNSGADFIPTGGTLCRVTRTDDRRTDEIRALSVRVMCDVDNLLYGEGGAAYVFAPQKGADAEKVALLDCGLRHISEIIGRDLGCDVSTLPGGGAAGGAGAGAVAFLGARLLPGTDMMLDAAGFDARAGGADLVITGEGRLDAQSSHGKVPFGVARRAARLSPPVPVLAVVGGIDRAVESDGLDNIGISAALTVNRLPETLDASAPHTEENLAFALENALRLIKIGEKR